MSTSRTSEQLREWEAKQKALTLNLLKTVCFQLENLGRTNDVKYDTMLRLQFPSLLGSYQEITEEGLKAVILHQIKQQLKIARRAAFPPEFVLDEMLSRDNWHSFTWSSYGYDQNLANHAAVTASSTQAMQEQASQYMPYQQNPDTEIPE